MSQNKKIKILKALEKAEKKYKRQLNFHINSLIKSVDKDIKNKTHECFKYDDNRHNIEYFTGIKIKKVGFFYF